MKYFEEFLERGVVRRQMSNKARALSLVAESQEKKKFLSLCLQNIPTEKMNANFVVDYCYDILMELIRAKMFLDGFTAGNSHEAEVSYLRNLGFAEVDVQFMDEMRYFRNGTKYYGTILEYRFAEKVLAFMNRTYPKLLAKVLP